ncbi:MAG: TGS domain-containing protein [bacterium]|nr:TGS domain-containing protein [bacterium]
MTDHREPSLHAAPEKGSSIEPPFAIAGLEPETARAVEAVDAEQWRGILAALESDRPAYEGVDWQDLPPAEDLAGRLEVMGHVKALVPENNIEIQKQTHNRTIENHIKLLLEAAGNQSNLEAFLELAAARLLESPGSEQTRELAKQAFWIWAPAAEIVGSQRQKETLEDKAFEVLFPEERQEIVETYLALGGREAMHTATERYKRDVYTALEQDLPELAGRIGVDARRKSYYSVWRKCAKRGYTDYRIPDFIGVRVLVDAGQDEARGIAECYAVVSVVNETFEPVTERFKDYIQDPKPNGYRGLHLTLEEPVEGAPSGQRPQLEVQIRTTAMHENRPSHMFYSAATKLTPGTFRDDGGRPSRMYRWRDLAAAEIRKRPDGDLSGLAPKVLVFGPDGNLFDLPPGATALDFSFEIHSRRALRTRGVEINGTHASFEDRLSYGDWVRVDYGSRRNKRETWRENWLDKVSTRRSRSQINRAIKAADPEAFRRRGERILCEIIRDDEEMRRKGIRAEDPLGLLTPEDIRRQVEKYGVRDFEAVLRGIGAGSSRPGKLVEQIKQRLRETAT